MTYPNKKEFVTQVLTLYHQHKNSYEQVTSVNYMDISVYCDFDQFDDLYI